MNRKSPSKTRFQKIHDRRGFISIIAIGVFALLAIFGIIIQLVVVDTYQNLNNNNNYYTARNAADSIISVLQYELKNHEAGFNSGKVTCNYASGKGDCTLSNGTLANVQSLKDYFVAVSSQLGSKPIKVVLEAKGRANTANSGAGTIDEKLKSSKCFNSIDCYLMPFPAQGDAGKNCDGYKPFDPNGSSTVPSSLTGGITGVDNADYACNWNKLTYGSSAADRVAIPLYYDPTKIGETVDDDKLIYPYKTGDAKSFILRIRTPCTDGSDYCTSRPVLNIKDDDVIVVQWQLNGVCKDSYGNDQACGMIADPNNKNTSAIHESTINANLTLINNTSIGLDINSNTAESDAASLLTSKSNLSPTKLDKMTKPILTLFLSKGLLDSSTPPKNIPYLEYQVLTDYPTGNSKEVLTATVTVDGNTFKKTLTKEVKKPLIDFAVQN